MIAKVADYDAKAAIYQKLLDYRQDPIGCFTRMLGVKKEHIWSKMVDVAESVRDNQFTAVPAGHAVSKTYTAGRIVAWFKTCYQPSTVITTAPNDNLVRQQLWREIHAAYAGAKVPLGGNMTSLLWDMKPSKGILESLEPEQREQWEKNFAIGFSTSPDQAAEHATRMQGWHNKWILVILDEACGILRQIVRTVVDSLIINKRCKVLAIGNLTDPLSEFARACEPGSGWNVVHISVKDTPNYIEGREIIPNVAGREYEENIRKTHGINSNAYKIRVLGEPPDYREGSFYGREYVEAERAGNIGDYPWDPAYRVYGFWDLGDMYTAGGFVQFIQGTIRLIDCYWDNQGSGVPIYGRMVKAKPYIWGDNHYAGPDLVTSNAKSVQTGKVIRDTAAEHGLNFLPVPEHSFDNGIEATRLLWPLLRINKPLCKVFLQAAQGYRKKKNQALSTDDQPVYHDNPEPSWERHMMDMLRHLAVQHRYDNFMGKASSPLAKGQPLTRRSIEHYENKAFAS